MIRRFAVLLCALLLAPLAHADQFEYVDLRTAEAALKALHRGDVVQRFCAPCGDTRATATSVRTLGIDRIWARDGSAHVDRDAAGQGFWTVELNGAAVDLAYVYVRSRGSWRNLAVVLGLKPVEVPSQLPASAVARR